MDNMYQNYKTLRTINPFVLILGLIFALFFIFWFIKNIIFKILYLAAPVLLVAALILNYRVVLGYGKWLLGSFKGNPWFGLAATALTIVGYPFVSLYLVMRAYQLSGDIYKKPKLKEGEYIKFSKVTEEEKDDFLDISSEKKKKADIKNRYDDLL